MDFARVLHLVIGFLEQHRTPYALIGGLALAAYGLARATIDVDLVVPGEAQDDLVHFLQMQGYRTLHLSPSVFEDFRESRRYECDCGGELPSHPCGGEQHDSGGPRRLRRAGHGGCR